MLLVLRNALGALSPLEMGTSMIAMLAYIALAFMGSVKLFELGALEYAQRLSFKRLFAKP
jgi:hypothetical protein